MLGKKEVMVGGKKEVWVCVGVCGCVWVCVGVCNPSS